MMFDWNHQDQVGDTIWAEFEGAQDHIVPYPKDDVSNNNNNNKTTVNNDETYLNFGDTDTDTDTDKKKINEEESDNILSFPEQDTQKNNVDFEASEVQKQTDLQSKLEMESWPDLPSLNGTLERDYSDGNGDDNMASAYLNDFETDSNLDKVQVQLEVQPDGFGSAQEGKSNSFLDCDWGNIGDFEDFDRLFSNEDSIFGTDMGVNGGEFLLQPSDVINSTVQSIPIPHLQFSGEEASGHGSSSAPSNDISSVGRIKKPQDKAESEKKIPKFRKKGDERVKSKTSQSQSTVTVVATGSIQGTAMQTIPPPMAMAMGSHHLQVSPTNFVFPGYRYPGYTIPAMQLSPKSTALTGYKRSENLEQKVSMTPQEKIEKLRRRQQMQAMLAIQQQQQQLGHQVLGNDNIVPQANSPRNQTQNPDSIASSAVIEGSEKKALTCELNMSRLQEEYVGGSMVSDDPHLEETIYYQLQDALAKLDVRIRLCMRDSLLRLAESAMERQCASTNYSSNPSDSEEEKEKQKKEKDSLSQNDITTNATKSKIGVGEEETGTNPIDRTVAQLLFHKSSSDKSSSQLKEEPPISPSSKVSATKSKSQEDIDQDY